MSSDLEPNTEANRLYWETETSVSEIAQRLNFSRRALYDALHPVPTGAACVFCGGELVYENRSARASHEAICAQCRTRPESALDAAPVPEPVERIAVDPRTVRLGGAMVVGAIVGAVATLVALPRR